jgi:hypothetical protein
LPVLVSLLLVYAAALMAAPQAPKAPTPPAVDAKSKDVLGRMTSFLAGKNAFTVQVDLSNEEVLQSGVKVQRNAAGEVRVQRPDKAYVTVDGDVLDRKLWYDGSTVTVLFPATNLYISADAPATLDKTIDFLILKTGLDLPLADYLYSDPMPGLLQGVRLSHYLGDSEVMGTKCIHLAFKQATINWQVWVEDSATPVPRKIVVDYKSRPGCPQYVAYLSDWKFPETLSAEVFQFTAPAGARQMPLLEPATEVAKK